MSRLKVLVVGLSVVSVAAFSGCAGSVPSAAFSKPLAESYRICQTDEATVKLVVADGVPVDETSRKRLEDQILGHVNLKKSVAQCKTTEKRSFVLNSKITTYEEGSAFARLMMAGLGQMHIDGDFTLSLLPENKETLAAFSASKTFAWGGAYGYSTNLYDIEGAFFESVADAVVTPAP